MSRQNQLSPDRDLIFQSQFSGHYHLARICNLRRRSLRNRHSHHNRNLRSTSTHRPHYRIHYSVSFFSCLIIFSFLN